MNKTDLVREWFEYASTDLNTAAHLFETMRPRPLEIICYHCQQAVEKALKGFLLDHETEPPRTHDLEQLRLLCANHDPLLFETIQEACQKLTDYAVSARYPSQVEIEETNAIFALAEAGRLYTICVDMVPELRPSGQGPTLSQK